MHSETLFYHWERLRTWDKPRQDVTFGRNQAIYYILVHLLPQDTSPPASAALLARSIASKPVRLFPPLFRPRSLIRSVVLLSVPAMARSGFLPWLTLGLGLIGRTRAQQSTAFTDPETGITYQQVTQGTFNFGIALPENPTTDFIGRISAQGSSGWAGVSLGGRMSGSVMVVAWPNEEEVVASLRKATGYSNPGVFSGSASLKTISTGTSFDGTTYTYSFLCEGCIQTDGSTFSSDATTANLGWGLASAAVSSPSLPSSPLTFHAAGFGLFGIDLAAAQSSDFAEWAALANDTDTPGDGGSNPTPGNGTVPISNTTYDYIVVGGGPAGLVTSQRLTETGSSVLLIERGMASTASTGGTRFAPWNQSLTYYDVPGLFSSLPAATLGEGYCTDTAAVAGCVLGGGGSVNGMAFIHPPSWDFDDNWPEGWKWSDMEPSAARLYARNPGTTTPSRDGKWYDNEAGDVLRPWLEENGWTYADGIENPDDKVRSFGPPQLNVSAQAPRSIHFIVEQRQD